MNAIKAQAYLHRRSSAAQPRATHIHHKLLALLDNISPNAEEGAMMATETHYQLLGVPEEVSLDQIKQAYKKLQFKYHPDRNVGKPVQVRNDADGKCKALSQALNVLSDETSRRDYDAELTKTRAGQQQAKKHKAEDIAPGDTNTDSSKRRKGPEDTNQEPQSKVAVWQWPFPGANHLGSHVPPNPNPTTPAYRPWWYSHGVHCGYPHPTSIECVNWQCSVLEEEINEEEGEEYMEGLMNELESNYERKKKHKMDKTDPTGQEEQSTFDGPFSGPPYLLAWKPTQAEAETQGQVGSGDKKRKADGTDSFSEAEPEHPPKRLRGLEPTAGKTESFRKHYPTLPIPETE